MTSAPHVASVVLNFGDPSDTLRCVEALGASSHLEHSIVVVDNGSSPVHRRELTAGLDGLELLETGENLGYAGGNNHGIRHALREGADFVLVLNPDVVVEREAIARLVAAADLRPSAGVLGPRVLNGGSRPPTVWSDGAIVDLERGGATHHRGIGMVHVPGRDLAIVDTDYVVGSSMMVRASVFRRIGYIPEEYFLYFEETAFNLAAAAAGWDRVVVQDAVVHHHRRSLNRVPAPVYAYYFVRGRLLFAATWAPDAVDRAWDDLVATWVEPWRQKVRERAPAWAETFDELVERGRVDGLAGRTGRRDDVHEVAPAVVGR